MAEDVATKKKEGVGLACGCWFGCDFVLMAAGLVGCSHLLLSNSCAFRSAEVRVKYVFSYWIYALYIIHFIYLIHINDLNQVYWIYHISFVINQSSYIYKYIYNA